MGVRHGRRREDGMPPPGQGTDPAEHRGARPGKQAAEDEARHAEEDPQAARKHRGAELEQTDGDGGCQNIEGGREAPDSRESA